MSMWLGVPDNRRRCSALSRVVHQLYLASREVTLKASDIGVALNTNGSDYRFNFCVRLAYQGVRDFAQNGRIVPIA